MAAIKAGDRVTVVQRELTAEDTKTGLYYKYFGGLIGTVDRAYDDDSVCVDIDLDSLEQAAQDRHMAMQEAEKQRWLNGLSQEVRNRLTAEQQKLTMSYKILVSKKDLQPFTGTKPAKKKPAEAKPASGSSAKEQPPPATEEPKKELAPEMLVSEPEPKRLSQADLDAAEEAALRAAQQTQDQN